jgi:hypothetical protein
LEQYCIDTALIGTVLRKLNPILGHSILISNTQFPQPCDTAAHHPLACRYRETEISFMASDRFQDIVPYIRRSDAMDIFISSWESLDHAKYRKSAWLHNGFDPNALETDISSDLRMYWGEMSDLRESTVEKARQHAERDGAATVAELRKIVLKYCERGIAGSECTDWQKLMVPSYLLGFS